ncbi:hypothetical protein V1525DRAFT_97564 [Lipomyces kononenkoae]|uniref:Uncharacterized protein n=1 Tax=Lipomyces kononenkoae TaxID=34357 RepID=A0ACC3TB40_LIPKO
MLSRRTRHQITDPRRLIRLQKLGKVMSAKELERIENYRERERNRQKHLRALRRQIYGARKRGRKPAVEKSTSGKRVDHSGLGLLGNIDDFIANYQQNKEHNRSTTDPVDLIVNGFQRLDALPVDRSSIAAFGNQHLKYSEFQYEASSQAAFPPGLISDQNVVVSQLVHRASSNIRHIECDGHQWLAALSPSYAATEATEPTLSPSTSLESVVFFPEDESPPGESHMAVYQSNSTISDCMSLYYSGVQAYGTWNIACADLGHL